jgi:phage head maturation protease
MRTLVLVGFGAWLRKWWSSPAYGFAAETTPRPIDQVFAELRAGSPVRVTRAEALSLPMVLKGRDTLCSIASLPLRLMLPDYRVVRSPLLEQLDTDVPNIVTLAMTVEDLLFEAIAWWRIKARDFENFPISVERLTPSSVSLVPPIGRASHPLPAGQDPRQATVWVDGVETPGRDVIRFDSPNPAVLVTAGRAIRRALALAQASSMYAEDPRPADYFTPADAADPIDDDEAQEILGKWRTARRKRSTAWVPAALKYNTVDVPSPHDLQLAELKKDAGLEIANALGIDPEDLGISTTSRTYANAVDRRRDRINERYAPYMRAITDRLSMPDVTRRGYTVAFDLEDYLKSNPTEQWSVIKVQKELGVLDVPEIRRSVKLPPATEPAAVTAHRPIVIDAAAAPRELTTAAFAARPTSHQFTFAGEPEHTFDVDTEKRTITGLAVPWGQIGIKYGMKFRFRRGSLQYSETSRVKHYKDHVTPVGKALDLKDTRQGLAAKLSVSPGPTGDELLQLADDEVYDGLSIGVDFDLDPAAGDVVLARDGVFDVVRADLREISTTPMPSFDNARVTRVAASREGGTVTETVESGQTPAPAGQAAPQPPIAGQIISAQHWSEEQLNAALAAAPHGVLAALMGHNTPGAQEANAAAAAVLTAGTPPLQHGPTLVDPTRRPPHAFVRDPEPYRFDRRGNLTKAAHDFSTDLYQWQAAGDMAARDRAMGFVERYFERRLFDVATTDVNELNPTRNRPEMYVDQRDFQYPLWDTINKGTLADISPFTFPKFSSAAGLVGAHTEGVEPTSGTYVTTNQTVTPTAVSGKMTITRETWDQGGNPQVSALIWRQMLKAWFEALEAAAVAVLDAASPTQIDLSSTPGLADEQLDDALTQAFASLQFIRGGFRMDNMFTQVDLFKALVGAKDASGRHLFPALGPTNATGTSRARWSALDINGITALPAWALAASGSVAASSYLFDAGDVHGWATAPQRIDITTTEIAKVHIGLWGYKAAAISDITGVREIVYDPA